ncbi:hypothetical protein Aperf_G00000016807 [Anoplocephala perfoliata]
MAESTTGPARWIDNRLRALILVSDSVCRVLGIPIDRGTDHDGTLMAATEPDYEKCEPEDAPTNQTSTIFWSHRGFKIDKDSPFILARWDNLGTLMIYQILPRKLYLWCHIQSSSNSHIFIHHLEFVASPFIQVVYAVEMNVTFTTEVEKLMDDFYFSQMSNCIIHSESGGTVLADDIPGVDLRKAVVQKTAILEAVRATCESHLDCIGVSLDFFECYINTGRDQSIYSIDFSTIHSAEMGIFLEMNVTDFGRQVNQTVSRIESAVELSKGRILSVGFGKIPRVAIELQMDIQHRIVKSCLGVSGKLSEEGEMECDLCPAGSALDVAITLPPPPDHSVTMADGSNNVSQEYLATFMWPRDETSTICRPCPIGSYTEMLGQPYCLPCSDFHNTPLYGDLRDEGGEWIELACARVGRNRIILQDFFTEANEPLGKWIEGLPEVARVWIFLGIFLGILLILIVVTLLVYCCFDVEKMLTKSADELRPLYIEAAIVAKTAQACGRERTRRAVEKMKKLMEKE